MSLDTNQSFEHALANSNMDYLAVYQVKEGYTREYGFTNLSRLTARGITVSQEQYDCVYSTPIDIPIHDHHQFLNHVYAQYNLHHPEDFKGRSLSVSDVIALKIDCQISTYFVDSFGFVNLPDFLGDTLTKQTNNIATLSETLCARMQTEYNALIAELKTQPSEVVMERAYEKVLKQEFLIATQDSKLSKKQLEGLLCLDAPLATLYGEWLSNDLGYMEPLNDTLHALANAEVRHMEKAQKKQHTR